ncbi:Cysteine proteinase COT44 [Spatholobus suberectus]|nr:Cysteine proteinase COT44 [Spatholobus suberectus]
MLLEWGHMGMGRDWTAMNSWEEGLGFNGVTGKSPALCFLCFVPKPFPHVGNKEEWEVRFEIYRANVQFIEFYNPQNYSYKLTDNKFADLTNKEFRLAAGEGINKIITGKLMASPEQLIDCDNRNGKEGCQGGDMDSAFTFVTKNGGLATDKNYPYQGSDDTCNKAKAKIHAVTIRGYENIPAHNGNMLKAAVAHQPVSVATDAGGYAFQLYSKGIFSDSCGKDLNHGMTIVGYGEENGEKYWLVKNSWANDWGESGYIRMKHDTKDKDGTGGIAMEASYPVKH